jgi:ribose 5-phosphate isomerase A
MSDEHKRAAARAAIAELPEAGVIGLGSGSTIRFFVDEIGALVASGRKLVGVPTSRATAAQATQLGIPLLPDEGPWTIDVCVDGADEVDPQLQLVKGGGGAHTREKIVNQAARKNVIIVDESKLSPRLGEKWPVPVEVAAFGHRATAAALSALGEPTLRTRDGATFLTDAGNPIYDVHTGPIADPAALERRVRAIAGVVEVGLFVDRADLVIVAGAGGVRTLRRKI